MPQNDLFQVGKPVWTQVGHKLETSLEASWKQVGNKLETVGHKLDRSWTEVENKLDTSLESLETS
jgi:Flp pilus assembly pilin Flp